MKVNAPQIEGATTVNFTMTPAWALPVKTAARVCEPPDTEATTARTHHSIRAGDEDDQLDSAARPEMRTIS